MTLIRDHHFRTRSEYSEGFFRLITPAQGAPNLSISKGDFGRRPRIVYARSDNKMMAVFLPLGGCVSLFYFCLPLYIEARATQEMHFSPIYRHCDSAWPTIRDRLHLLQKYHFRKQTLLSNRGEGARTVEIHPPSTCLFWRARWVQSSLPLKVPFPSLFLLRRCGKVETGVH